MIQATQIRKGMLVKIDGVPHIVMDVAHITPGNWRAIIQCKMRNLMTNVAREMRLRSSDRLEEAEIEPVEMEYIYMANELYYFMNVETYEQVGIDRDILGDTIRYLKPNVRVKVEYYEGKPFGIVLPKYVELKVIETQAYLKDATAQAQSKPATLEGGLVCQVPPFVEVDNVIKINTETGEYVERA
jgi:elongation factor P